MLFIILLILKIIGITLLVILGLLLFLILIVLLVPIRYRVAVEHGDEMFRLRGRVHWLLHILHASITHLEGILHIRVRVFGYVIFDNLKPRKPKVRKNRKTLAKRDKTDPNQGKEVTKSRNTSLRSKNTSITKNEPDKQIADVAVKNDSVKEQPRRNKVEDEHKDTIRIVKTHDSAEERTDELPEGLRKYAIYEAADEDDTELKEVVKADKQGLTDVQGMISAPEIKADVVLSDATQVVYTADNITTDKVSEEAAKEKDAIEEKVSFLQKIKIKLKRMKKKIASFFSGLKSKLLKMLESVTNIKHKIGLISDFIKDEINREGFSITYSSLKRLLKHIKPRKLKSKLVFGTGDPCSTGQVLGVLGVLYGFYGDKVQIIPDFENNRFEGTHYARGRIRLVTILIIVIKLILDKRFKQLKSNFQILKEAL